MLQIGLPTVDRPFGIELWPIFDVVFEKVVGYPAHKFQFIPGWTYLSTVKEVAAAIAAYYAIIWGGYWIMKTQPSLKLNGLFMAHNLFLTMLSAALLALFIEQLFPIIWRNGIFYSICSPNCWTQKIVTLYYVQPRSFIFGWHVAELFDKIPRVNRYCLFVP